MENLESIVKEQASISESLDELLEQVGYPVGARVTLKAKILEYDPKAVKAVIELSKEIAKKDKLTAEDMVKDSPKILKIYSEEGWMNYLPRVIELGKEIAKESELVASSMFKTSPKILKYGYDTLEKVVKLAKELAKKDEEAAAFMLNVSPKFLKKYKGLKDDLSETMFYNEIVSEWINNWEF